MKHFYKKLTSVAVISATIISTSFAGDLRKSVCFIRESSNVIDTTKLNTISSFLKDNGYLTASHRIKKYGGSSFSGSGFVFKNSKGECVVMTNKHVVNGTKLVDIIFENSDGKRKEFKSCIVVDTAKANDIAVVRLPKNFDCSLALPMHKENLKDGKDVFSAGYPAIGDKPVWQFAKGIVSNSKIRMEDLGYSDTVVAIQHTAAIDGGSSGGPLLIKVGDGYEVVGMNTWSARRRQTTNLSLFVSDVKNFADNTDMTPKAKSADASLASFEKEMEKFIDAFKKASYSDMQPYLADSITLSMNQGFFENSAKQMTTYEAVQLRSGDPMDGLRSMCIRAIVKTFKNPSTCTLNDVDVKNGIGTVSIKEKNGKITSLIWKQYNGAWKLADTNGVSFTEKSTKKKSTATAKRDNSSKKVYVDINSNLDNSIELGYGFGLTDNAINRFKFEWNHNIHVPFVFWGLGVQVSKDQYIFYKDIMDYYNNNTTYNDFEKVNTVEKTFTAVGLEFPLGFTCPIVVNQIFRIMPYVKGAVGFNIYTDLDVDSNVFRGLCGGLKFGYKLPSDNFVFISGEYRYRKTSNDTEHFIVQDIAMSADDPNLNKFKSFMINIGLNF